MYFPVLSQEECEKNKKKSMVTYILKEKNIDEKIDCILKAEGYHDLNEFFQFEFAEICRKLIDDHLGYIGRWNMKKLTEGWESLWETEKMSFILEFFQYENFAEWISFKVDRLYNILETEITSRRFVVSRDIVFLPREHMIELVHQLLTEKRKENYCPMYLHNGINTTYEQLVCMDDDDLVTLYYKTRGLTF